MKKLVLLILMPFILGILNVSAQSELNDFEGETKYKKTCLWLKGLEPLKPTRKIPLKKEERTHGIWKGHFDGKTYAWNSPECAKMRSKTPKGVAEAMAEQWG